MDRILVRACTQRHSLVPEGLIAHFNIVGFRSAVAALKDSSLLGRPYVIAGGAGGRAVAWDVSPEALRQNIRPGMALAAAERIAKDLRVIPPDPQSCQKANEAIESVIKRYAPVWQNDGSGNLYLDISGTRRLFGPPADCLCRVQNEIMDCLRIRAAAAAASNKLVSKVASRAIRPLGLIDVRHGDEASFLANQDITLLPGIGQSLMKTIRITGFRTVGELAALSDGEALSLFGKKGILLRDSALGIDDSPVAQNAGRVIESRADFSEDAIDETVIRAAIASAAEHAGLQMRKDKLGAGFLSLYVSYADGMKAEGKERQKRLCVLDRDIALAAQKIYQKTVVRRIRIRALSLSLSELSPLNYEPDLFEPESESKSRKLQEAVDKIQLRYGEGVVMKALILTRPERKQLVYAC